METKCRWIKEDPLAFDLLDHRPLGQDVLERLAAGQASELEVETAELGQRMILVADRSAHPIFGAQVTHEDRDNQGVGFVAGHLHKAGSAYGLALSFRRCRKNSISNSPRDCELAIQGAPHRHARASASTSNCSWTRSSRCSGRPCNR